MRPDQQLSIADLNLDAKTNAALALLDQVLVRQIVGKTAIVSSFGAESAVLLDLVAKIDRHAAILFIDTQMLFEETLTYFDELSATLALTNVTRITPDPIQARRDDVFGRLHKTNPDKCCDLRKTQPLANALSGYTAWISGRKRHQTAERAQMALYEADGSGRVKINPLADWERADLKAYFTAQRLPDHPLTAAGFTSIGCAPCTQLPTKGADERSGRWAGQNKSECGIHYDLTAFARLSA
jgi:phosphoadenosine phosphosulfate reductase